MHSCLSPNTHYFHQTKLPPEDGERGQRGVKWSRKWKPNNEPKGSPPWSSLRIDSEHAGRGVNSGNMAPHLYTHPIHSFPVARTPYESPGFLKEDEMWTRGWRKAGAAWPWRGHSPWLFCQPIWPLPVLPLCSLWIPPTLQDSALQLHPPQPPLPLLRSAGPEVPPQSLPVSAGCCPIFRTSSSASALLLAPHPSPCQSTLQSSFWGSQSIWSLSLSCFSFPVYLSLCGFRHVFYSVSSFPTSASIAKSFSVCSCQFPFIFLHLSHCPWLPLSVFFDFSLPLVVSTHLVYNSCSINTGGCLFFLSISLLLPLMQIFFLYTFPSCISFWPEGSKERPPGPLPEMYIQDAFVSLLQLGLIVGPEEWSR